MMLELFYEAGILQDQQQASIRRSLKEETAPEPNTQRNLMAWDSVAMAQVHLSLKQLSLLNWNTLNAHGNIPAGYKYFLYLNAVPYKQK